MRLIAFLIGESEHRTSERVDLFQLERKENQPEPQVKEEAPQTKEVVTQVQGPESSDTQIEKGTSQSQGIDLFQLFILKVQEETVDYALKADDITSRLELVKSQTNAWLKRGVAEGSIKKLQRPIRYQATGKSKKQSSLF